jgi:hypothetical protein
VAELDSRRLTASDLSDREARADLAMARSATGPEVWSGRALNVLLRSLVHKGNLNRGPNIPLEPSVLRGINLNDKSSRGNLGLLKGGAELNWPAGLQDDKFKAARDGLEGRLRAAARQLKEDESAQPATLRALRGDYRALSEALDSNVRAMPPTEYIGARRYLNQVQDAIKALAGPRAAHRGPAGTGYAGDLVDHMARHGLAFAPAVPGDEAAYTALHRALLAFEAGLKGNSR